MADGGRSERLPDRERDAALLPGLLDREVGRVAQELDARAVRPQAASPLRQCWAC